MTDTTPLTLFNSLTRQLEPFAPLHGNEARVYSCGPTVYNYAHIGNMRAYIFADTLGRALRFKGYDLKHVINITDVGHLTDDADAGEDKLEKAAKAGSQSIWDIAAHYTAAFKADCAALNITPPAQWTVATDYVPQMIAWAEAIADKHCYFLPSGLYFDVSTVPDYGRLARASTEAGEGRIDAVDGKRNPQDFAIWRLTPPGETRHMEWDSPWGRGAPGWHLECSVMSGAVLGQPFDIHTGGIDHREIHHPNEIAQNQAHAGCSVDVGTGARIWMHNNFLIDRRGKDGAEGDRGKMSKSSGEFLRLQTLIDRGYHPLAYRMLCLQAHYRSELEFTWEGLTAAFVRLKRLVRGTLHLKSAWGGSQRSHEQGTADWVSAFLANECSGRSMPTRQLIEMRSIIDSMVPLTGAALAAMDDDLKTPELIALYEQTLGTPRGEISKLFMIMWLDRMLGLNVADLSWEDLRIRPVTAVITEPEIEAALARRKEARAAKDFATSDAIRDELIAASVEVMDGDPLGWDWKL